MTEVRTSGANEARERKWLRRADVAEKKAAG